MTRKYWDQQKAARVQILINEENLAHAQVNISMLAEINQNLMNKISQLKVLFKNKNNEQNFRNKIVESENSQLSILAVFWRFRRINLKESLKKKKIEEYDSWKYAVNAKLKTNMFLYLTDKVKIHYALSQMKELIFSAMQDWMTDDKDIIYNNLLNKIEHYMSFHLQQQQVKKNLQIISQQSNETISMYYHQIHSFW